MNMNSDLLSSSKTTFHSYDYGFSKIVNAKLIYEYGYDMSDLNKVYHSESMHEMLINADLMDVDLCNPFVLMHLADTTAYHHAFWPHTAKRFLAFKNILRHNKKVRESMKDGKFLDMLHYKRDAMVEDDNNSYHKTPGRKQEMINILQVIDIVEKCVGDS